MLGASIVTCSPIASSDFNKINALLNVLRLGLSLSVLTVEIKWKNPFFININKHLR